MNLNIRLPIFNDIDKNSEEIRNLNNFDPLTNIVRDNFQRDMASHLVSLNDNTSETAKVEIIKHSTALGTSLDNAIGIQKKIYNDLGRRYTCAQFMFDMIPKSLDVKDIELLYEILFEKPGFRDRDVFVITENGDQHKFIEASLIKAEMEVLLEWHREKFLDKDIHPLTHVAYFHHQFLKIHPYLDGNGRIARLVMSIILMKFQYLPILVEGTDRQSYFKALETADQGNLQPLLEFISEKELFAQSEFIKSPHYLSILGKRELSTQLSQIRGKEKCFVLTEDKNYKGLLTIVFSASGFNLDETTFISYEGCSKLSSVVLFTIFMNEKLPQIKLIVHRDRDYLTDEEISKEKENFDNLNVEFFVTDGTDIESHLLKADHVHECHQEISIEDAGIIINECIQEAESISLDRFRTKEFGASHKNKSSHLNNALVDIYQANKLRFVYGKKALGLLKSKIQGIVSKNSNIEKSTKALQNLQLRKIATGIWS